MCLKVMLFPDFPFREDLPSFPRHEDVRRYLVDYTQHFGLLPFIKVSTAQSTLTSQRRIGAVGMRGLG